MRIAEARTAEELAGRPAAHTAAREQVLSSAGQSAKAAEVRTAGARTAGVRIAGVRIAEARTAGALADRPAAILLDIQLPEMDGYMVAEELQKHAQVRDVPIVAVTSYAMPGDRERILAAGATGYIEKPINPETFVADVARYLIADEGDG